MGLPFIGELLTFLWYFKIVGQPDEFIESKRRRYGDGVGMYRTYLFGSPAIIGCSPEFNKFVFQSHDLFPVKWPTIELFGHNSLAGVSGKPHTRLRTYVSNAINKPDALRKVCKLVQPHIVSSLRSWADKGKVKALDEVKKVTFENIGNMFVSFKPGPMFDVLDKLIVALVEGVRAQPLKIPGTAYYHAFQCRKKLAAVFREELEKRKRTSNLVSEKKSDLMEGLMNMTDEEGKLLSDEEVLDNIVTLVIAAYDSTALAITMALYYIAKSPHVLKRLRVVDETIRMANVNPFTFRYAKDDVNYQGFKIPKNWQIMLWIRYLHTDPKNFDDPMNFNPDRWDVPAKPGTYQVFGGGARICPGSMLAKMQIAIFIHHLVIGYKWELKNPNAKIMYLPNPKPVDGVEISFSTL
ncbi:hypothetical protein AQUCO_07400090v1 [Aquilegia coerulea]|uniref:Cytochrome P450 n=1 Tax=Aquilegia coerulea TaxID=218851 RepID=A0A2G5C9Q7_AQUCA|nr:hypothetical protein AQUCO_07400090v1 [Aquilegia coerulea]